MLDIEPVSGTVTVGPPEALDVREIAGRAAGVDRAARRRTGRAELPGPAARARRGLPGAGGLDGDLLRIRLRHPARGVARGQAAVLYDGDAVLGSATITATA